MIHQMKLKREPFLKIECGEKTVEMRLYDDKRQKIKVGDRISFTLSEGEQRVLFRTVEDVKVFDTFKDLYAAVDLTKAGYTKEEVPFASPDDMALYYPPSKLEKFKAVAIFLKAD